MRFSSTLARCLVGVLAIAFSGSVAAQTNPCQMCVNDVANSISKCKGIDVSAPAPKKISDLSSSAQVCMCAIAFDASLFMKCDPMCPTGNMEQVATAAAAFGTVYCKPDGSGPLNSLSSSSASSMPSSRLVTAAAAIVLSAVALA